MLIPDQALAFIGFRSADGYAHIPTKVQTRSIENLHWDYTLLKCRDE